ncbi:coiled-coil domain-containing protein 138-like [Anser cygnoides]|uniref:coiled-coil domain-containing protein 138-like n=1 Tax=Anser cygnoides TaxID=8845 RepID=UPI0034D27BF9
MRSNQIRSAYIPKELSDANEQNKKLDDRAKSMQAQLDNLKLYMTEMNRMRETVIEVGKENSTLKSSYNTVMDENESLKKQLSDAKEQNKKLEDRARSMQAQLNDSKQKHALVMTQKSNDSGQVVRSRKRGMEKNETGASKSDKQPDTEMNRMKETLRGVAEENSKLKSSFKSVMDENDSLKKQHVKFSLSDLFQY